MSKFILSAFADEIDLDLDIQMDVLERYGIKYLEMRGVDGKNVSELTVAEAAALKKRLDARGFRVSALGSPLGKIKITADFAPQLELLQRMITVADILETQYIRMFSFFMPEGADPAGYRDQVMRRWQKYLELAAGSNLILLHENEKEIYGDTPERCLDLFRTMHCDYLKAVFDPANFIQCDVETYPHAWELLRDHVVYLHIKDALYADHSVVPAGHGDGKIPELLTALRQRGYEGFLSLEPHLQEFKGLAGLELHQVSTLKKATQSGATQFGIAHTALQKLIQAIEV
jgi:sugar phosphate isomerase/epimerase